MTPSSQRDSMTIRLLRHFFHDVFCIEENIPEEKKVEVTPVYFLGWLDQRLPLCNRDEVCAKVEIETDIWDFLLEVMNGGMAPERLTSVWWSICLASRPQPKTDVRAISLIMLVHWSDGTKYPENIVLSREMLDGLGFTDAIATALVAEKLKGMVAMLAGEGIDGLYARGDNFRGQTDEDPYYVFMGALKQHLIPNLKPEYRTPVERYFRLCQTIFDANLPPEVRQHLLRQKQEMQQRMRPSGQIEGGFDG